MNHPEGQLPTGDHFDDVDLMTFDEGDDGFASFLELLGAEQVDAVPCTNDTFDIGTNGAIDVPTIPKASESKTGQAEVAADAARLERIRAKNRRGQARYREKLKREKDQLVATIDRTKTCLADSNTRYRALRDERAAAVARASSASAELDRLAKSVPPALHTQRPAQSNTVPPPHAVLDEQPCVDRPWPQSSDPLRTAWRPTTLIPLFGLNAGIYASVDVPVRDIASYSKSCGISLKDVFAHIPAGSDVLGGKDLPQYVPQAIREHQAATSAVLGIPQEDICWFVEMPQIAATGRPLSHSASIASPQCQLSLMVFGDALALEAGLLLAQHAALVHDTAADTGSSHDEVAIADAVDTAGVPPGGVHACSACIPEPATPDDAFCSRQFVRCGVNETCTIAQAVNGVIVPLAQAYRHKLPRAAWRSVCYKAMRKAERACAAIQANIAAAEDQSPWCGSTDTVEARSQFGDSQEATTTASHSSASSEAASERTAASTPRTARCAEGFGEVEEEQPDECKAMSAIFSAIAHVLWQQLQADTASETSGSEAAKCTRQEIEARMLEMNLAPAVSCVLLFQQAPHRVRQLCQDAGRVGPDLEEVERHQRRLLRSLALQPEQRAHCAQIWRQWYKKRRKLDREFDEAVDVLADRIPQAADVPVAFVKHLDCLAQAPDQVVQPETRGAAICAVEHTFELLMQLSDKLVGVTGTSTEGSAAVLRALRAVHVTDGLLYEHVVFLTVMPSWYLTQVQHTQLHASMLDEGVTLVDNLRLCQAAAQEERWKEVFTSLRL